MSPQLIANSLLTGMLLGSALVWLGVAIRLNEGRPPLPFHERHPATWNPAPVAVAGFWIAYELVNRVILQLRETHNDPKMEQVRIAALLYVALWSLLIILLAGSPASETRARWMDRLRDHGLRLVGWMQQLREGGLGFLASLMPVWGGLLMMQPIRSEETRHPFFQVLQEHPGMWTAAWIFFVAIILAPLTEELLFRVILQGWLQTRIRPGGAIGITAVVFCTVHGWADALPLLPLALILGYVYYRRHSYLAVVTTHMLFNGFFLTLALLAPER